MQQLIPAYVQQQLAARVNHGFIKGFTLNVDLSGFTKLTEDLMRQGSQGAEALSVILNEIFEPLVELVYRRGGFIPYFAGDAFTAVFPLPVDPLHALHLLHTADEARRIFHGGDHRFGGQYTIGIKSGIGQGIIEYGIVGEKTKAFYFRGPAINAAADCQSLANDQDIVIDQLTDEMISGRPITTEEINPQAFRILSKIRGEGAKVAPLDLPEIDPDIAAQFLPEAVVKTDQPGEFRTVISIFLAFDNLRDQAALSAFADIVTRESHDFGAYFKEIDFGDKGGLMTVFFGAPVSYENTGVRALEFALAVREGCRKLREQIPDFRFRVGITMGTAFTGIVGGRQRCQYACVGNRVNLAARIMSSAEWNEIFVDDEIAATGLFRFLPKGNTKYKGISEPVPVFVLQGRLQAEGKPSFSGPLIARAKEVKELEAFAEPLRNRDPAGIAYIYGEAGIGKSRLTHELRQRLAGSGNVNWEFCPCDQILRKPFNPFLAFLRQYFRQSREVGREENLRNFNLQLRILQQRLRDTKSSEANRRLRELIRTEPVLAALLGLPHRDDLWSQLDARGRYQNTIAAVVNLFLGESAINPLIIEMEDIHWIDEDSKILLRELLRRMTQAPIMVLCTARHYDDGGSPTIVSEDRLEQLDLPQLCIELSGLEAEEVRAFAEQVLSGKIHQEFLDVLLRASNSNPFYVEQLLEYFQENKLLIRDEDEWNLRDKNIKLSNSINSILTARIDRLSELVRETVKAAAVIGREFDVPVLTEVLRQEMSFQGAEGDAHALLQEQIALAEQGQIWSAMNELRYIFRHSLMREAAYSMQLNTRLQQLHAQIAEAIEKIYAQNIGEHYVDLVFHFEQAGNEEKTIEYLQKAADYSRANFQNQQALDFYERLIAKPAIAESEADLLKIHMSKGIVLEIVGRWEEAQQAYEMAQRMAKKSRDIILLGRTNNKLGQLLLLRGRYDEAMQYLQIAAGLFESIDDPLGIAKVNGNLGNLFFRRAKYDEAERYYRKSLDTGFSETGTVSSAQTVSFLGLTYMNRGKYEEGINLILQQLPLHEANKDFMGLANLHTNLGIVYFESGNYDAAREEYEKGLELADRLGNKQLQAIGTGCLGTVLEKQGQFPKAMKLYQRDLDLCRELGDWQGIAIAEGLVGELHGQNGHFTSAVPHLEQSLRISKELGYGKGVAKAINALGDLYYWQGEYEKSRDYYDEAIEIARGTDNRLVLASSLLEKCLVLLEMDRPEELAGVAAEAMELAKELGNPDLLVEVKLMHAQMLAKEEKFTKSLSLLQELATQIDITPSQMASAYYQRYQISPKDTEARDLARALYEQLYRETPKYQYLIRLEELRANTNT